MINRAHVSFIKQKIDEARRKICEKSLWAFAASYLPEIFNLPPSPMHTEIAGLLQDAAISRDKKWNYLVSTGQITTGFDGQPGDRGEKILKSFIKGDTIIAYASKYGALGFGITQNPSSYRLLHPGHKDDVFGGEHLHRLDIQWQHVARKLDNAISPSKVLAEYSIHHPIRTSVSIDSTKAKRFIEAIKNNPNMSIKS